MSEGNLGARSSSLKHDGSELALKGEANLDFSVRYANFRW